MAKCSLSKQEIQRIARSAFEVRDDGDRTDSLLVADAIREALQVQMKRVVAALRAEADRRSPAEEGWSSLWNFAEGLESDN